MTSAGRIAQSRSALPVRCRNTASRSGSSTSTELTATPASATALQQLGQDAARADRRSARSRRPGRSPRAPPRAPRQACAAASRSPVPSSATRSCSPTSATSSRSRPLGLQLAEVDDPDPVAQPLGLLHVVGRVEHRHPLAGQPLDALEDRVAALRIDADRRLVEDQQPRAVQQADPDVQAPLHPAREVLRLLARTLRRARSPRSTSSTRVAAPPRGAARTAGRRTAGSRARSDRGRSPAPAARSRSPPSPPRCASSARCPATSTSPASGSSSPQTIEIVVVLPGAVRAEEPVRLAWCDLEADPADGLELAEALAQPAALEDRGRRGDGRTRALHDAWLGELHGPDATTAQARGHPRSDPGVLRVCRSSICADYRSDPVATADTADLGAGGIGTSSHHFEERSR